MASSPVPSMLDAATQTFPVLSPSQVAKVRSCCGKVRAVKAGEILFEPGDTDVPFFVLLSGKLEIVQPTLQGERDITKHGPGQFTGEMTMISGRKCLVRGRVTEDGEFLELAGDGLRTLVAKDAELGEIFMRAFILRRLALVKNHLGNVVLLGSRHSAETLHLREFLEHNEHPFTYMDLDTDPTAEQLLERFEIKPEEIPVVICNASKGALRNPTIQELAECLGLNIAIDQAKVRDVIIIGAGPAGLAAAVYAASEGLDALVIETGSPGGQAGSSSKIENYLGFPTGLSGQELAARAIAQSEKFGAKMMVAHNVASLDCSKRPYKVVLDTGAALAARTIVIATGAQYRKLQLPQIQKFEGRGIYYGATHMEQQLCEKEDVIVVGGGNSAGQAAVFLSQTAQSLHIFVRKGRLADTMSRYLIHRIEQHPGIEIHYDTEIVGLNGNGHLEEVTWKNKASGETATKPIRHIFVMAGAAPRTDWLKGCLALDDKGFILTGRDLDGTEALSAWPLSRGPQMLETSLPGVFAVGDVRANNVKRVASAVGEGAIAVHLVHRALAEF